MRAVRPHRRVLNRLGVALQIGYLRLAGTALNSFDMIPQQVLVHLGSELGTEVPRLASIRALYRRRRTLFEHQAAARNVLGRDELVGAARDWLVEHRYLQLPQRRLAGLAAAAKRRAEAELLALAVKKVGKARSEAWAERLLEAMPYGQSRIEWLRTGPSSRKPRGLANHIAKITFLKQLGADELELGIPTLFLKSLAHQMLYRKPATLRRMRSAHAPRDCLFSAPAAPPPDRYWSRHDRLPDRRSVASGPRARRGRAGRRVAAAPEPGPASAGSDRISGHR